MVGTPTCGLFTTAGAATDGSPHKTGMHRHFRILAISEHLRNHGINPDLEQHTRIPGIWAKLRTLYNMDAIDDRENYDDHAGKYKEFRLPERYEELMFARRLADPSTSDTPGEAASSPPALELDDPAILALAAKREGPPSVSGAGGAGSTRKRKRVPAVDSASARTTRGSTVEDTEEETPIASSPVTKSARGARIQKRAAAKAAKAESTEPEANDDSEDDDGVDEDDEDDESEAEEEPATKSAKGSSSKSKGRTTRARANTRKGRK